MAKKRYSNPKLFIPRRNGKPVAAVGDTWYVYFYWRQDPDGPLSKQFRFRRNINYLKTAKERRQAGKALADGYLKALEMGWNPEEKKLIKKNSSRDSMTLGKALDYAFEIKLKAGKKGPTLNGYEFHKNRFQDWCTRNGFYGMDPRRFSVDHFYEFLDWLRFDYVNEKTGKAVSGSSVNNHKASLSALFTTMKNERLIDVNFIKDIPKVDSEVVNNKAFTIDDLKQIKQEMERVDPYLIPFFSFILYPLLRPREICRLQIKDFNTENWMLQVETKTDELSVRRIIKKLQPVVEGMGLTKFPANYHIFTHLNEPAEWDAPLKTKVDHFGYRFRKIKNNLGYGREYGLYSGRHTAIMDLYNNLAEKGMGEMEILLKLMPYTQHKSIAGIKAYVKRHRKTIPADHSDIYSIDF